MTPFVTFWKAVNEKLAANGQSEALFGEIHFYFEHRMSIDAAVRDLTEARS